ncbi:AraC-type DNA-binding protein [Dyadobacter koreensis]|uniref:AraC-type DNA-binding protein n=1 Tax=Dyadobacter koreensis TaxID=408657 RepID=A0A1H6Q3K3_9BACT|nr:helix-turn-helix domain-containing protein [Dyadobacter koreensis]SEI38408.1 AraC-type DNA-binding protein [Dyadobacter koreensis]
MKQSIHKHEDLLQVFGHGGQAVTGGFSVELNSVVRKKDFASEHFRSDYIIICMITSGNMTMGINFKKYNVPVNGFILAPPNALKQFIQASEDATVSVISFTGDFLNGIGISNLKTELFEYFSTRFLPFWQLDQQAADMVLKLMGELKTRYLGADDHPYGKELLNIAFQTFLYEIAALSRIYSEPVSNYVSRKENLVMEFIQLVQKHFRTQRMVNAYAGHLSVTAKYLTETVKEITGKNAGEMIDDVVMLEAKYLLNDPALNISQIADMLNFNDQSLFGKFFKRHTGLSPRDYRNLL